MQEKGERNAEPGVRVKFRGLSFMPVARKYDRVSRLATCQARDIPKLPDEPSRSHGTTCLFRTVKMRLSLVLGLCLFDTPRKGLRTASWAFDPVSGPPCRFCSSPPLIIRVTFYWTA